MICLRWLLLTLVFLAVLLSCSTTAPDKPCPCAKGIDRDIWAKCSCFWGIDD